MIEWQPALERPPPPRAAQPEMAGLFCWAQRYNARMRTQIVLLCLACSMAWSQSQQPPKSPPATKTNGTESTHDKKESGKGQSPPDGKVAITTTADEHAESIPKKNAAESKAGEDLQINCWRAAFTVRLVLVG